MTTSRRTALATLAGVIALTLGACASDDAAPSSSEPATTADTPDTADTPTTADTVSTEGVTLKIGIGKESAILKWRDTAGTFADTPYKVEWVEFENTTAILEGLAAGAVDMAPQVQTPAVMLAAGNADPAWTADTAPFSVVAAWDNPINPGFAIIVRDPSITTTAQLAGKKITYSGGSLGQIYLAALVADQGITDLEQVKLPPADGRTAFLSGAVDALATVNRTALALQTKGEGTIIDTSSRLIDFYQLSLATPAALADPAKSAAIADALDRVDATVAHALDHTDDFAKYLVDTYSLELADATTVATSEPARRVPLDDDTIATLRKIITIFVGSGDIVADIDPTVILDHRFDANVVRGS